MRRYGFFTALALGILVFALAGWAVKAARWAAKGSSRPHPAPA